MLQNPSLIYSDIQLTLITESFTNELKQASEGKKTSFLFEKTTLPEKKRKISSCQVICIGGSYFVNADVTFEKEHPSINNLSKGDLPRIKNVQEFFDFFIKQLHITTRFLSINFAFPLKVIVRNNLLDGILEKTTKEHVFDELIGSTIGKVLENYIQKTYNRTVIITVVNDVVCLALASPSLSDNIAAGVVGTGVNFSFFLDSSTLINLESGNFYFFPQSGSGKIIDAESTSPGKYLFEKETGGKYLYLHFNILLKEISSILPPLSSTKELDAIAETDTQEGNLARQVLEHSAQLIACQIAGIFQFKGKQKMDFIMEGSLFWKGKHYQKLVKKYIERIGIPNNSIQIIHVRHSNIIGAAKLFM